MSECSDARSSRSLVETAPRAVATMHNTGGHEKMTLGNSVSLYVPLNAPRDLTFGNVKNTCKNKQYVNYNLRRSALLSHLS